MWTLTLLLLYIVAACVFHTWKIPKDPLHTQFPGTSKPFSWVVNAILNAAGYSSQFSSASDVLDFYCGVSVLYWPGRPPFANAELVVSHYANNLISLAVRYVRPGRVAWLGGAGCAVGWSTVPLGLVDVPRLLNPRFPRGSAHTQALSINACSSSLIIAKYASWMAS